MFEEEKIISFDLLLSFLSGKTCLSGDKIATLGGVIFAQIIISRYAFRKVNFYI